MSTTHSHNGNSVTCVQSESHWSISQHWMDDLLFWLKLDFLLLDANFSHSLWFVNLEWSCMKLEHDLVTLSAPTYLRQLLDVDTTHSVRALLSFNVTHTCTLAKFTLYLRLYHSRYINPVLYSRRGCPEVRLHVNNKSKEPRASLQTISSHTKKDIHR